MLKHWLNFRDRCLTSEAFHKWVARFPPTRPILRKRQSELFDIVSGFVYSQVLLAVVKLDVLSAVQGDGKTVSQVSDFTGLGLDETRRLVEAAASLRLLQLHDGRYRLGDLGAALHINAGVKAMILHHGALYKDLSDPVALLQSGRQETHLSKYWDYALSENPKASDAEAVSAYSVLMSESQAMVAEEVLACFDFSDFDTLLDVGGGEGTFLTQVASQHSELKLKLFDLPEVAKRAQGKFDERGLTARTKTYGGSFFDDDLPIGADLISLVRIVHDHDDEAVMAILKRAHKALPADGKLIICEPMSTGGSALRISDAYFNFYLYAMGSGRPRSPKAVANMLEQAGFKNIVQVPTRAPLITSILQACK